MIPDFTTPQGGGVPGVARAGRENAFILPERANSGRTVTPPAAANAADPAAG